MKHDLDKLNSLDQIFLFSSFNTFILISSSSSPQARDLSYTKGEHVQNVLVETFSFAVNCPVVQLIIIIVIWGIVETTNYFRL